LTEATRTGESTGRGDARKRNLILVASALPMAALFALLGWVVVDSGGNPGGFGINDRFGEVPVDQRPAPGFEVETLDGRLVSLEGLRGKVVMLDFWSSWCPPCRREAPTLSQVYREYRDGDVEFIGMAIWDSYGAVEDYALEFDVPYPNTLDDKGEIAIDYGVAGIPEKFFIDREGNLVRSFVGPIDAGSLRNVLDGLLGAAATHASELEVIDAGG
jgi:cytochrome c biogenesis protein CcmG/thiol:disulfide interchange protein DsbE